MVGSALSFRDLTWDGLPSHRALLWGELTCLVGMEIAAECCRAASCAEAQGTLAPLEVRFQSCWIDGEAQSQGAPGLQDYGLHLGLPSACGPVHLTAAQAP